MVRRGGRRGAARADVLIGAGLVAAMVVAAASSCGGGSGAGAGTAAAGKTPNNDGASDSGLMNPVVTLQGGSASTSSGQAQAGGTAHLVSGGGITLAANFTAPTPPTMMAAPADAMAVSGGNLQGDIDAPGSIAVSGNVTLQGTDAIRQIVAQGDIFVTGTLRSADVAGTRQGLTLRAPNGTVYISGALDTSGKADADQAGGAVSIVAQQVVVTGKLVTAGAASAAGGAVSIMAANGVFLTGTLDASGGTGKSNANPGGGGGALTIQAGGDVVLGGTSSVRGGSGGMQGGNAGAATIDASGAIAFTGTFDGRGGPAHSGGAGGTAATLKVGETTRPTSIGLTVPLVATGGQGAGVGGDGGNATLEAHGGDLRIGSLLDVSGGSSSGKPGGGGTVIGTPGPEGSMAALDISGQVTANGGDIAKGGTGNGGGGGLIKFVTAAIEGTATIESTGQVQADGGASRGTGTAGKGGMIYVFTIHGDASMHGQLLARGGGATDSGGTGGLGGFVYMFTGNGHDRMSGVLIIESDGTIDASGGAGTIGGSARNDGVKWSVATWPTRQDDEFGVDNIAILINSDGVHGSDHGWLDNRGHVIARGGATGGSGGDIAYHGKMQDGNETPVAGNIDNAGDGSGMAGDFAGE